MSHSLIPKKSAICLLLLLIGGHYAFAQNRCSAKNLQGSFGFSISGKIINTGTDCAISGRFEGDGKSQISGTLTENAGGHLMRTPFKGTYTMNNNCTGSIKFNFPNGLAVGSAFTMIGNGDKMYFMNSDDASTVPVSVVDTGTIQKQQHWTTRDNANKCSAANLHGTFGLSLSGTRVASNIVFVTNALMTSDGQGHVTGSATESVGGHVSQGQFSGSYKINPDCTGTATFQTPSRTTENFDIVLVNNGHEVFLIGVDDGTQQIGTASRRSMKQAFNEK